MDPAEKQAGPEEKFRWKAAGGRIFWRKLMDKSRFLRMAVGWLCVLIGLFGIIMPIIPGIPFLLGGLVLLSTEHRWVRGLLIWTKRRLGRWWPRSVHIPPLRRKMRPMRRKAPRPEDRRP